jgi:hypothetical protein
MRRRLSERGSLRRRVEGPARDFSLAARLRLLACGAEQVQVDPRPWERFGSSIRFDYRQHICCRYIPRWRLAPPTFAAGTY